MVHVFKLISGEELIGAIVDETDHHIMINNPLVITYMQSRMSAYPVVYLNRYMPVSSQEDITFSRYNIISIAEPVQGLEEYYEHMLAIIKETTDVNIVTSLADAVDTKNSLLANTCSDFYKKILENMESKGTKH